MKLRKQVMVFGVVLLLVGFEARAEVFELTLDEAERSAIQASNLLKSSVSDVTAAEQQADAQFESLLPKLSFQASYQYLAYIPAIALGNGPAIPFGTNSVYSAGPALNYTLWDTFSGRRSYQALSLLEEARREDRESTEIQVRYSVRAAYVQVQLGIEELKLIHGSRELALAEDRDVKTRYRAGAAAKLDVLTSERSVLNFEIQFKSRQALLSAALRDLLTLLGDRRALDIARPGPPRIPGVSLILRFEPLGQLIAEQGQDLSAPPGDEQPKIRSLSLQADSLELSAASQSSKLLPLIQVSAGITYNRPDIPEPPTYFQESVGATLSLPLFFGDPSRHLSAQQRSQADSARFHSNQLRDDLQRDFAKAHELLLSLREQRLLAARDVEQSEEEARLYFTSYKAGKINLIDVQNSNNQALQAKVSATRIDAQILNQLITLKSLSGKEPRHD